MVNITATKSLMRNTVNSSTRFVNEGMLGYFEEHFELVDFITSRPKQLSIPELPPHI